MTRDLTRRRILAAAAAAGVVPAGSAQAQAWPQRPIRIIVGFPPGGLTDLYARSYGDAISQILGQSVVIENRAGAGSIIACEAVAKAPPDGYTLLFTIQTAMVQNQVLYKKLPYDPNKDFTFIGGFGAGQLPLAVPTSLPIHNAPQLIEYATRNEVNFGTYAPGSYPHMVAAQMNKLFGTKFEVVHFRGEAPMWIELAAGRIHAAIGSYAALSPHIQAGKARVVAVPTTSRSPKLPEIPTFIEQGLTQKVFGLRGWLGLFGPAGMPEEATRRIAAAIDAGFSTPRVQAVHGQFGIPDKPLGPADFFKLYREEGPDWIAIVKELGVSLD